LLTKEETIRLLERHNYPELYRVAGKESCLFRTLISLTYDKNEPLCWMAIEAIGVIAGKIVKSDLAAVRSLVQRLLWMMRDESGNNPGSAPEILGEIVRNAPDEFADIVLIIASFHDEEMLRPGVLRAILRIGEVRPEIVMSLSSLAGEYLKDSDALTRAYAALLAGGLGLHELIVAIESLVNDSSIVRIFRDGDFDTLTVGKIAEEIVIMLSAQRK
jgi:hypothetical protein